MKSLKLILKSLHKAQYLTSNYLVSSLGNKQTIFNNIILKNGQKLRQQLLFEWQNTTNDWAQSRIPESEQNFIENRGRLSFVHCREFQRRYQKLCQSLNGNFNPIVFKKMEKCKFNPQREQGVFKCNTIDDNVMLLVSEYFVPASNGLEKFFNIQRERKIWWMRYSANPSRYFLEPFHLVAEHNIDDEFHNICQSITIKSSFPYSVNDMESITLVPLHELKISNRNNKKVSQMSVIRSVINLDLTTCAIILDASEHNRENTLMLNRKLAPYQVVLVCQRIGDRLTDIMNDLSLHIEHILRRAGLRLYDKPIFFNSQIHSENELISADSLGIPYAILLDENSIKTGLMKLRSRDTSLSETIHISDLPNYLLNIFTY